MTFAVSPSDAKGKSDQSVCFQVSTADLLIEALLLVGNLRALYPGKTLAQSGVELIAFFLLAKNPLIDGFARIDAQRKLDQFLQGTSVAVVRRPKCTAALSAVSVKLKEVRQVLFPSACSAPFEARRIITELHLHHGRSQVEYLPQSAVEMLDKNALSQSRNCADGKADEVWTLFKDLQYERITQLIDDLFKI